MTDVRFAVLGRVAIPVDGGDVTARWRGSALGHELAIFGAIDCLGSIGCFIGRASRAR